VREGDQGKHLREQGGSKEARRKKRKTDCQSAVERNAPRGKASSCSSSTRGGKEETFAKRGEKDNKTGVRRGGENDSGQWGEKRKKPKVSSFIFTGSPGQRHTRFACQKRKTMDGSQDNKKQKDQDQARTFLGVKTRKKKPVGGGRTCSFITAGEKKERVRTKTIIGKEREEKGGEKFSKWG